MLQDFWTVVARRYLALLDMTENLLPIVRQGTLVYLTPTAIPKAVVETARLVASCFSNVLSGMEQELGAVAHVSILSRLVP